MNARFILVIGIVMCVLTSAFSGTRIQSSLQVSPRDEVKLSDLKKLRHPWAKEQPLPSTLADCGLDSDAKIVLTTFYLDGGSRLFALKDSKGAYLLFCTSKPFSQAKHDGDTNWNEFFLLGATNYLDKAGALVPRGSPTETLLLKVINGRIVSAP